MNRSIKLLSVISLVLLFSRSAFAYEYGQVVRIQCERTGQYLAFDPTVGPDGDYKIILQNEANDDTLWIVKGTITAPVSVSNPYDRWNCTFGNAVPTAGYDARLEHVVTGYDAHFGDYMSELTGHTHPYTFKLGQSKVEHTDATYFYNIVLDLFGEKKILISNEYLCAIDTNEAILTQDATPDTWNIVPVYMMLEDQKGLAGQDLLDALTGANPPEPTPPTPEELADHMMQDVNALISFYNNEIAYRQEIQNAFTAIAAETDINARLTIAQGLETYTVTYNDQKAAIFSSITHPETLELIQCVQDSLNQNKLNVTNLETDIDNLESAKAVLEGEKAALESDKQVLTDQLAVANTDIATLQGEKQVLTDEITTINTDLSAVGATSVTDLTSKVNQLIGMLTLLWQ